MRNDLHLKGWLYSDGDDQNRYKAKVAYHPSLMVGEEFLEDMRMGRLFERIQYECIQAQHYGPFPKKPIFKVVAILTYKSQETGEIKQSVVVEGQRPWENWFDEVHSIVISPDGSRVAAVVSTEGTQAIVVDDEPWTTTFDQLFRWHPKFSPDSKRLAVTVVKNRRTVVVVDDEPWEHLACRIPNGSAWPHSAYEDLNVHITNDRLFSPQF